MRSAGPVSPASGEGADGNETRALDLSAEQLPMRVERQVVESAGGHERVQGARVPAPAPRRHPLAQHAEAQPLVGPPRPVRHVGSKVGVDRRKDALDAVSRDLPSRRPCTMAAPAR